MINGKLSINDAMPNFSLITNGDLMCVAEGLEELIYKSIIEEKEKEKPP